MPPMKHTHAVDHDHDMNAGSVLSRPGKLKRMALAGASLAAASAVAAAAVPAVASADTIVLAQGSSGSSVSEVQRALNVPASGQFDRGTRTAVLNYQVHKGLQVDGVVGPQTETALFGHELTYTPTTTSGSSNSGSSDSGSSSSSSSSSESSSSSTSSSSPSSSSGGYSIPSGIVQCESGGNYHAVNSSSGAGGAYQILPSTWHAYGGSGSPQSASKGEQDRIAGQIYANQGGSAWSC